MKTSKHTNKNHDPEIRLTLDGRNRISLSKFLTNSNVSSFKAYTEDNKIILEPMVEIPARELWLHENTEALKAVKEGLQQSKEGKIRKRKSYAKNAKDEI